MVHTDLHEKLLETRPSEIINVLVTYDEAILKEEMMARISSEIEGVQVTFAGNFVPVLVCKLPAGQVAALEEVEGVKHIFADYKAELYQDRDRVTSKSFLDLQKETADHPRLYLNESTGIVGAPQLWDLGINGSGIYIAIIDTGVNWTHPDLAGKVVLSTSFVPYEDPMDYFGHGTHVAGIAAGTGAASAGKFKGVAPGAYIMNIKIFDAHGYAATEWILAALDYTLLVKPDVVSMSWGDWPALPESFPVNLYITEIAKNHIIPVAAAGNFYYYWTVGTPANNPYVISVGATAKNDRLASFTSKGPDIYTLRTLPTVSAPGVDVVAPASGLLGSLFALPENPYYATLSGTSMSAPHVAGAVALLLSAFPSSLTNAIRASLILGADDIGYDINAMGAGRLNAYNSYEALAAAPIVEEIVWSSEAKISSWATATPATSDSRRFGSSASGSARFSNAYVYLYVDDWFFLDLNYLGVWQGVGFPAIRYYDEYGYEYFFWSYWASVVEPFTKWIDTPDVQWGYGTITDGYVNVTLAVGLYGDNKWFEMGLTVWSNLMNVTYVKTYVYFDIAMASDYGYDTAEYILGLDAVISYDNAEQYFLGVSGLNVSAHHDCGPWYEVQDNVYFDSLMDRDYYSDNVGIVMQWDDPDGFAIGEFTYQPFYLAFEDSKTGLITQLTALVGRAYVVHDLAITDMLVPSIVPVNTEFEITTEVSNLGTETESNITVTVSIDGVTLPNQTIPRLEPLQSANVTFIYTFAEESRCRVTGFVYPVANETIINNNYAVKVVRVGPLHVLAGIYPTIITGIEAPIVARFPGDIDFFNLTVFTNIPLIDARLALTGNASQIFSVQQFALGALEDYAFVGANITIPVDAVPGLYVGTVELWNGTTLMAQTPIEIEVAEPIATMLWDDMHDYILGFQFLWRWYITYWQTVSMTNIRVIPQSLAGFELILRPTGFDAVLLMDPYWGFMDIDITTLIDYVKDGGNLFIVYGQRADQTRLDEVPREFGIEVIKLRYEYGFPLYSNKSTILEPEHPAVAGVNNFTMLAGWVGLNVTGEAVALANVTDVVFYWMDYPEYVNFTVIAAYEHAPYLGRLLVVGNDYMFDDAWINTWWYVELPYIMIDYTKVPDNPNLARTTALWTAGDVVSPTVSIVSPTDGEYVKGVQPITVSAEDGESGIDKVEFYINGILTSTDMEAPYEFSWSTTELFDGVYSIEAVAYDKAGNTNSASISVIVDNTEPELSIISPESGTFVAGSVSVRFSVFDTNLLSVTYSVNGGAPVDITGEASFAIDTTTLTDGTHAIAVTATDKAGNSVTETLALVVDNTLPSVSITAPADGDHLKDAVIVNVTGNDANLDRTELYISGELVQTWTTGGTQTYGWDTSAYTDGSYTITLAVYDKAGNLATTEITVTVDNTAPIAEIREPTGAAYLKGTYEIAVYGHDTNLDLMELYIDGDLVEIWTVGATQTYTWDTTTLTDGDHTIKLVVYDKAGNTVEKAVTVTVDNTLPTVSITAPADGAELAGAVTIEFSASDTNLDKVLLYIDDAVFDVTGTTSYDWDTTAVGDGSHTIRIVVTDEAGNSTEMSIAVTTVNVRRATEATRNLYLAVGTPIGLVIGALIVYVVTRRRGASANVEEV